MHQCNSNTKNMNKDCTNLIKSTHLFTFHRFAKKWSYILKHIFHSNNTISSFSIMYSDLSLKKLCCDEYLIDQQNIRIHIVMQSLRFIVDCIIE